MTGLRSLNLSGCYRECKEHMFASALRNGLSELTHLDLSRCPRIFSAYNVSDNSGDCSDVANAIGQVG